MESESFCYNPLHRMNFSRVVEAICCASRTSEFASDFGNKILESIPIKICETFYDVFERGGCVEHHSRELGRHFRTSLHIYSSFFSYRGHDNPCCLLSTRDTNATVYCTSQSTSPQDGMKTRVKFQFVTKSFAVTRELMLPSRFPRRISAR